MGSPTHGETTTRRAPDRNSEQCPAELQMSVGAHVSFGGFTIPSMLSYPAEVIMDRWESESVSLFGPWEFPMCLPTSTSTSTSTLMTVWRYRYATSTTIDERSAALQTRFSRMSSHGAR